MVRVFAVVSLRTRRQRAPFSLQEEVKKYFQETVAPCLTEGAAPLRAATRSSRAAFGHDDRSNFGALAALTSMWSAKPDDPKQWLADFLTAQSISRKTKPMVYVIYYSMHGHVRKLVCSLYRTRLRSPRPRAGLMAARYSRRTACALRVMCGAWAAQAEQEQIGVQKAGCDCKIFQVPETLPADGWFPSPHTGAGATPHIVPSFARERPYSPVHARTPRTVGRAITRMPRIIVDAVGDRSGADRMAACMESGACT